MPTKPSSLPPSSQPFFSRQELALLVITVIWGTTFLIIRYALEFCGPLFFVALRFTFASVAMGLISITSLPKLTGRELFAGIVIGVAVFGGYTLQTVGLQYITASKSAFITAAYVPAVPLLQWLITRRPPGRLMLAGVCCAFAGLILLAGPDGVSLGYGVGEIVTVLSALSISIEILLISFFARNVDTRRITVIQVVVVAVAAYALMPVMGETIPPFSWTVLLSALVLGVASGVIQFVMNWAQKSVPATKATLIYAGEPVWAGIFGRMAGERLPHTALLGGVLVVVGVIVSSLKRRGKRADEG